MSAVETASWPASTVVLNDGAWCLVHHPSAKAPAQGWKLHVSATVLNAREILARVLPVLLSEPVTFKVCQSRRYLAWLNAANGGLPQIGKFITIYPNDDGHAVALAGALDAATNGLFSPRVRSDRALHDCSIVSYRYGVFARREGFDLIGRHESYLEAPDGSRFPDSRSRFQAPPWSRDPFRDAGFAVVESGPLSIANRYVRFGLVHASPRGDVYEAVDVHLARPCVVKSARRGEAVTFSGEDSVSELCDEAAMLSRLRGQAGAPLRLDLVQTDRAADLVMEEVKGTSLRETIKRGVLSNGHADISTGIALARSISTDLAKLHRLGIVHRDVHPGNVIVDEAGRPRLIDFGLAQDLLGKDWKRPGQGMRGYASPQQLAGLAPSVADDVHAFGALLYFVVTGADLLDVAHLRLRGPDMLNLRAHSALRDVVAECMAPDTRDRFPSMSAVMAALDSAASGPPPSEPALGMLSVQHLTGEVASLLVRFGETLHRSAYERSSGCGWPATVGTMPDRGTPWLYEGDAGVVYALAEMLDQFPLAESLLRRGARGLVEMDGQLEPAPDGLFIGRAGLGFALLRAAMALDDKALLAHARTIGREVARCPPQNPDMLHGVAGRIRFQLALHGMAGDTASLARALQDGLWLCKAVDQSSGRYEWHIPEPWGSYSAAGYAHGSAGIADALLSLWEVTGEPALWRTAEGVAEGLAQLARPAFENGTGIQWPVYFDEVGPEVNAWCHGAAGIASFFLHCHVVGLRTDALDLATRAGWTLCRGRRTDATEHCHGLAGHIEFLLDLFAVTGDSRWRAEAQSMGGLLLQSAMNVADNRDALAIDIGSRLGLMTGEAGLMLALVHLHGGSSRSTTLPRATSGIAVGTH